MRSPTPETFPQASKQEAPYFERFDAELNYKGKELGLLKPRAVEFIEWAHEAGLSEEKIRERLPKQIAEMAESYFDGRFHVPNKKYLMFKLEADIKEVFAKEKNPEQTNLEGSKIALFNFDLNGLKAVNDILGHSKGDDYLREAADMFDHGGITRELRERGYEVFAANCGGDEYSVEIKGSEPLSQSFLTDILYKYQMELQDLRPFTAEDNEKIKQLFREEMPDVHIPDGFEFYPTMGGGFATLNDAYEASERQADEAGIPPERRHPFHVGGQRTWYNAADMPANINKELFKLNLANVANNNMTEQFLSLIILRNKEARDLRQQAHEYEARAKQFEERAGQLELENTELKKRLDEVSKAA